MKELFSNTCIWYLQRWSVGCLEFNVPFQHKYGYIIDDVCREMTELSWVSAQAKKHRQAEGCSAVDVRGVDTGHNQHHSVSFTNRLRLSDTPDMIIQSSFTMNLCPVCAYPVLCNMSTVCAGAHTKTEKYSKCSRKIWPSSLKCNIFRNLSKTLLKTLTNHFFS